MEFNEDFEYEFDNKPELNCYKTLYTELLTGEIRANDDFRILQYECAIRSVVPELNVIIQADPSKIIKIQNEIKIIKRAGIDVCDEYEHKNDYFNSNTGEHELEEWIEEYIWLDGLYLDYPFLKPIKNYTHPIYGEYEEDKVHDEFAALTDKPVSKLNIPISKSQRTCIDPYNGLFGSIYDSSIDLKIFLKQFPSVLDADKKDLNNNIERIIDMFYVYDQCTFFNKAIKNITPLYNLNQSESTMRKWIKRISLLTKTYKKYHLN